MSRRLFVGLDLPTGESVHVGSAHVTVRRGVVSTTFLYDSEYLQNPRANAIDPDLPLVAGPTHVDGLPGAFADSAPDQWGRNLIAKRLRASAPRHLVTDLDFLLEVSDATRQGALRFRDEPGGPALAPHSEVPPLVQLPRLLRASERVASGDDTLSAVKVLLDAGTGSLGGARPKASVRDGDELLIAKFPHPHDTWDVMRWEATALTLAELSGIQTPRIRLASVEGEGVLILARFDREGTRRVGYLSAMSLTGATDGDPSDYVDVAEAFSEVGDDVTADLAQLWRRIVFSVAMRNTDDHLRNHGFVRRAHGWRLAPAFDLNPNPDRNAPRITGIFGAWSVEDEVDGLLEAAPTFGVSDDAARRIIAEVLDATGGWRQVALAQGVTTAEVARFADSLDDARARLGRVAEVR